MGNDDLAVSPSIICMKVLFITYTQRGSCRGSTHISLQVLRCKRQCFIRQVPEHILRIIEQIPEVMPPDLCVYIVGIGPAFIMLGRKIRIPHQHTVNFIQMSHGNRASAVTQSIDRQRIIQEFTLGRHGYFPCIDK